MMIGGLALLGVLSLSQVAGHFSRSQIERDQGGLLKEVSLRMASRLSEDLNTRANQIAFAAKLEPIQSTTVPWEGKRSLLEQVKQADPHYAWLGLTDVNGTITVATGGLAEGKSVATRSWFLEGSKGLHYGDAHDAFLLAKLMPPPKYDDLPLRLVDISMPLRDRDGRLLGVIAGHLSLDWAFEVRSRMLAKLKDRNIDLVVLNKAGKVLMGTPELPSLKVDLQGLRAFQQAASEDIHPDVELWPDGKTYLTAAVAEPQIENNPRMGWVVVARKAEAVAFAPADRLANNISILGMAIAALFMVVMWIMLNRQLRPLEQVSDAADKIRTEDLTIPIPQPSGQDEIAVFARSLTELVASLQDKNIALRLTNRLFEESGQGMMITDSDLQILRVNKSFSKITKYSLEEVIGRTPKILQSGLHDADFYREMWKMIRRRGAWQGEIINNTKEGILYPEWLSITALRDEEGNITHYIGIFDDITERKRIEEELRSLNTELEDRVEQRTTELEMMNKELEAFSYSVSHDLCAPLRAIDGFSQVLLEDYSDQLDQKGKKFLQRVRGGAQRMAALIDDLLMLSRTTQAPVKRQTVNMSGLVRTSYEQLRENLLDRQIEIDITESLQAYADPNLMNIALINLLDNASKYTSKCEYAKIEFSAYEHDGEQIFYFKDNGAGFDMRYADKLFGTFQRLHSDEEFAGTGIGLATVQRIIHRHGGRIWAESEVDKGATIFFTLPVDKGQ